MNNKYNGMYLGIVVQNNDPEHRGRLKVYIPHVSYNVYADWYENNDDKSFKFPGGNIDSDLSKVIEPLKRVLPWAECAAPLVGASGSGRYNSHMDQATISDGSDLSLTSPNSGVEYDVKSKYNLNSEAVAEQPGRKFETEHMCLNDAFTTTLSGSLDSPQRINKYTYTYKPTTYSNKTKGAFSIPNVGSHVWCFFREGEPQSPVYFATSFGQEDWAGIYHDYGDYQDYPDTYENRSKLDDETYDVNTETYRNKFVLNQKGGTLEFVNTDNREILKLTHFSGSFKEFTNQCNVELATANDQKLVLEDSFQTVKGFQSEYIGRDHEHLVKGDRYTKVGKLDVDLYQQWAITMAELNDVKQLFETRRADVIEHEVLKKTSKQQTKSGTAAPCPVCNKGDLDKRDLIHRNIGAMDRYANGTWYETLDKQPVRINNLNEVTSSMLKASTRKSPGGLGDGIVYINRRENAWSPRGVDETDHHYDLNKYPTGAGMILGRTCPVCGGSGLSPSSMGGDWMVETLKETKPDGSGSFDKLLKTTAKKLFEIEKLMGVGGSAVEHVAKHKTETIGLHMNDFPSVRVDDVGKISRDKVVIHPGGTFNSQQATPLLEYVHVDDMPGGTSTLNVCNKWNVQVGAGGVSIKSYGSVDLSGTITNIAGDQVNIGSENEINIDGGRRVSIVADIISLRQRNREQVLVDSNLGVTQNLVIGGGLHVEGELSVNHITAPVEIQETDPMVSFGQLLSGLVFKVNIDGGTHVDAADASDNHNHWSNATITVIPGPTPEGSNHNKVRMYPHTHHFRNVPLNLKEDNDAVREDAMDNNNPVRRESKSVESKTWYDKVDTAMSNTTDSTDGINKKQ